MWVVERDEREGTSGQAGSDEELGWDESGCGAANVALCNRLVGSSVKQCR